MSSPIEILIVEDSPTQAEQLRHYITAWGYKATVARNGKQALGEALKRKPDLVISDVVMPEMDGYTLCRKIKAHSSLRDVAVILLTSLSAPQDVIKGLECGADNFIRKPYDEKYLHSRVDYILTNRELRKTERMQVGVQLYFGGRNYFITAEKQQILDLLISTYESAVQINDELETKQRELARERDLLHTLMDNVPDFIYFKDTASRFTTINPAQARALGVVHAEEALGKTDFDYFTEEYAREAFADEQQILRTGKPLIGKLEEARRRDGLSLWISTTRMLIRDVKGSVIGTFGVSRDITQSKLAEEERNRFFTLSLDLLCVAGFDGYLKQVSPAFERVLGFTSAELMAEPIWNLIHADDHEACKAEFRRLITGRESTAFEIRMRCKDGSYRWILWNAIPLVDRRVVYATGRDITERRQAEAATRLLAEVMPAVSSAEHIDKAMSSGLEKICKFNDWQVGQAWVVDEERQLLCCVAGSFYTEVDVGQFREDSLKTSLRKGAGLPGRVWERGTPAWIHDLTKDCNFIRTRSAEQAGLKAAFAFPISSGEKLVTVFEFFSAEIRDPNRHFLKALQRIGPDLGSVFERKRADEALRASEQRFRAVAETATDAIVSADRHGHIVYWNGAAERIFGYSPDEVLGKPLTVIMPERLHPAHHQALQTYLSTGAARVIGKTVELVGRRKDASEFPLDLSLASWRTGEGIFFTGIMHDTTVRKRAEEELRAANKELEAFSYSVSHDLRAPLRHINGFAKILEEEYAGKLDDGGRQYLRMVSDGAQKMGALVDDLLGLARVGRQELSRTPADLGKLVEEVICDLKAECADRNIRWRIRPLPVVECDAGLMKQVFVNLLSNAVKYTRPREQAVIEVGESSQNNERIIFVRDNGVGFDMKYAAKLFEVFQRLHRTEDFEGTGVGLATVQRIIKKHGGRVWAQAQPGKGTTFFFTLEGLELASAPV